MFRKLVSNLPFSPALVGQLGLVSRRLRKEQLIRRLGIYFVVLALIIQSFAVFAPAEQASASTGSSIIEGGVQSVQDVINIYDASANGQNDFKDISDYIGITRDELAKLSSQIEYVCSSDSSIVSFNRQHQYSTAEGEITYNVPRRSGGTSTIYSAPLQLSNNAYSSSSCYDAYIGNSKSVGWFAITKNNGNIQTKQNLQKLPKGHFTSASCRTIQGYAYDENKPNQQVKVYLYIGGLPGKGREYGPILADQVEPTSPISGNHGFSFTLPDDIAQTSAPVEVWGVLQPAQGWTGANVQFDSTISIPANCDPASVATTPSASCTDVLINRIDRTHITIEANSAAAGNAAIAGYQFIATDKNGKQVYNKTISTSDLRVVSDQITLTANGDYSIRTIIKTSLGDKECASSTKAITVAPTNICIYNASLLNNDPACQACPYKTTIWVNDENCVPNITQAKEAKNLTQAISNANDTTARPSDRIEYTIYTINENNSPTTTSITEGVNDVLQYSQLVFAGGGIYDSTSKTIAWNDIVIPGKSTDARTSVVQINSEIASTPRGANDPTAYDCVITNSYGNTISINMQCPIVKSIESIIQQLPATNAAWNVAFGCILFILTAYFYARSRLINKEIRIIRKEFNEGTL